MSEKIYIGKGKESKYGIKFSICLSDIPEEHTFEYNGKTFVKLEITQMRKADDRGKTHTVTVDTWKPEEKVETRVDTSEEKDNSGLPF
jgi:hypothetical protein